MSNPFISIVIPIYNVDRYLKRCLDSLLLQTYKNYEVILIDDGSTDKSSQICDTYAAQYEKFRAFHVPNGGVSNARNIGVANARGEAVLFIDSDDAVKPDFLESFILDNLDVDKELLIQGCICENTSGKVTEWRCPNKTYCKDDFKKAINDLELFKHGGPTCKLYSLNVIKKNNLAFNTKLHNFEDLVFFLNYIKYISTMRFSSNLGYIYYVQDTGLHLHRSGYSNERLLLDNYLVLMDPYIESPLDNISAYALSLFYRLFRTAIHEGVTCVIDSIRTYRPLFFNSTKYLSGKTILINSVLRLF